jgi:dihydroneopterin aldolase
METDCINIAGLAVETTIGVLPWERLVPRRVVMNVTLGIGNEKVFASDAIEDAVDYAQVAARLEAFAKASSFRLLEAFADAAAKMILDEFPVPWTTVEAIKPAVLKGVKEVGVKVTRKARLKAEG